MTQYSKGEQTANRILAAGTKLFAQTGYAATSMRDIAEQSGVRAGAIYNHFASKQDLLMAILTTHMQALLDEGQHVRSLKEFVTFHIQYHHDKADEVFLSYMELRSLEAQNFQEIIAFRDAYERRLMEILKTEAKGGRDTFTDEAVAVKAIIGMLASLSNWYQEGGRLELNDLIEIYCKLTSQMLGAQDN